RKGGGRGGGEYVEEGGGAFGYFGNEGVPVFMRGVQGRKQMAEMLDRLRADPPREVGGLEVAGFEDRRDPTGRLGPLKGATDAAARNVLVFRLGERARVVLRPSGTEP